MTATIGKLLRDACAALSAFDADGLTALCDEHVEFASAITSVDTVSYHGHAGVRQFLESLQSTFEWLEVTPMEVTGDMTRAVATNRFRARGRGSGVELEQAFYQAIRLRDGRATWWRFYDTRGAALAAIGLED